MSDCVKCWRMRLDMIEFDDILLWEYGWRMRDEILLVFCWMTQQQQGLWKQNKNVISFPFQFQNKQQELCGVIKVRNGEFVCDYCFKTLTNPLKLPCGYDLCEECVLEGWGEEEINWERERERVEWRRRVWGYCEEWYLKRERENGNERIGDLNEWNEWMIDFDVCEWWLRWNDIHSFLIILIISYHSIFIINTSQQ